MKKSKALLTLTSALLCLGGLAGCNGGGTSSNSVTEIQTVYQAYVDNGGSLSYEEWLATIKGDKGDKGDTGATGAKGDKGDKGDPGDTGAAGKDGVNGEDGKDGSSVLTGKGAPADTTGNDGDSYIDTDTFDYYIKTNGAWSKIGNIKGADGANGNDGTNGSNGADGVTPRIGDNGNWWIGETDTGVKAAGTSGSSGTTPTVTISGDGYWVINGEKTAAKATGDQGEKGDKGDTYYANTILPSENGYVSTDKGSYKEGETVTFTAYPNKNYMLASLTLNGVAVELTDSNVYTATMGVGGFVVRATFAKGIKVSGTISEETKSDIESTNDATIVLTGDVTVSESLPLSKGKTVYELGGHTLTSSAGAVVNMTDDQKDDKLNIEINNGFVVSTYKNEAHCNLFDVYVANSFTLDHVDVSNENEYAETSAAIHCSATAKVTISNGSKINFKGTYGVATNNTLGENGIVVIDDSEIVVTSENKDNCLIVGNTVGYKGTITNSTIKADRQGVIARTGTWDIENSTIEVTGDWLAASDENKNKNLDYIKGTWKDGNEVPSAAIVVGDESAGSYLDNVVADIKNTDVLASNGAHKISVHSKDATEYTTTLKLDAITYMNILDYDAAKANTAIDTDSGSNSKTNIDFSSINTPSVSDLLKKTEGDNKQIVYFAFGYISEITNEQYGNAYLEDQDGSKILLFGAYTGAEYSLGSDGSYSITKTEDTKALTKDYVGKWVGVIATFDVYKGTKELVNAVVVYNANVPVTTNVTVNDSAMGTATLSKTENIAYGEEITVTAAPAEGYVVSSVKLNSGNNRVTDITDTMKFNATAVNQVVVTFKSATAQEVTMTYDFSTNESTSSFRDGANGAKEVLEYINKFKPAENVIIEAAETTKGNAGYKFTDSSTKETTYYTSLGMKFGTSSNAGSLKLTLSDSSWNKIIITGVGWTASDTIAVGGKTLASGLAYGNKETKDYEFSLALTDDNKTFEIVMSKRFFIQKITFVK